MVLRIQILTRLGRPHMVRFDAFHRGLEDRMHRLCIFRAGGLGDSVVGGLEVAGVFALCGFGSRAVDQLAGGGEGFGGFGGGGFLGRHDG